tara:strand:+ start:18885 stop:19424 length:540 start_codon:yes stop_codon:yes gene_type:complete
MSSMSLRITDKKTIEHYLNKGLIGKKDTVTAVKAIKQSKGESSESLLFKLLLEQYGDYFLGGELVKEYRPIDKRRFRLDVAMPNYKLGLEVDGLKGHAFINGNSPNVDGFKRDREKDMVLTAEGWHIIRCMRSQIQNEKHLITEAITTALQSRTYKPVKVVMNDKNICHPVKEESNDSV